MSTISRSTVIRGPGTVTLGSTQIFDRDGIKADVKIETFGVPVSAYGEVDTRRRGRTAEISFRPSGAITAGILTALYPHGTPNIGASLMGATDTACIVHSLAGQKVTFHSAALMRMPSLRLSSSETAFGGEAQVIAVNKNNVAAVTDNSLYTVASEAWAGAFDTANIKGGVYTGTWGTGGGAVTLRTMEGWTVEFDMQAEAQQCDGLGIYDYVLGGVTVRAKCVPIGISESDLLGYMNLQGTNCVIGGTMRPSKDLVIAATGGLTVTIREAALVQGPMDWGQNKLRAGEIGFIGHRTITGGVPVQLFSVALTA